MKWTKFKKIFLAFNVFAPLILSACVPANNYRLPNPVVVNPVVVTTPSPNPEPTNPTNPTPDPVSPAPEAPETTKPSAPPEALSPPASQTPPPAENVPPPSKNPSDLAPPDVTNQPTEPEAEVANPDPVSQLSDAEIQQQIANSPMPILNWLKYNKDSETNNPEKIAIPNYTQENKSILDFFLRRTIVLSYAAQESANNQRFRLGNGTGTILGKASTDPNSLEYYVATNIHVSNNLINNNPDQTITNYQFAINPLFNKYYDTQVFPSVAVLNNEDPQTSLNLDSDFQLLQNQDSSIDVRLTNDFYNFTRSTKDDGEDDKLFYQAANIQIKPHTANRFFKFAADFSVAKIDFSSVRDQYLNTQSSKGLIFNKFLKSLKTLPDAEFAWSTRKSTPAGYLAGFPGIWDNSQGIEGIQYVNLAINNPGQIEIPFPASLRALSVNINNQLSAPYQTPTNNIYATNLSIGPGSSGSMFINQQGQIEGIYWGTISSQNSNGRRAFDNETFGQITKLRVAGAYDLIGGTTTKATTPHVHSFCDVANQKNGKDKTVRVPNFCR